MTRFTLLATCPVLLIGCSDVSPDLTSTASEVDAGPPPGTSVDAAPAADATPTADPPPPPSQDCEPCQVTGPGTFCGLGVSIEPFSTGGVFGGFQSQPGTGQSMPIQITLSAPINWVSVQILDPDFYGNEMRTYSGDGTLISSFEFPSDGVAYAFTAEMGGAGGSGIERVDLIPATGDYVAYDALMVVPEGCGAPVVE